MRRLLPLCLCLSLFCAPRLFFGGQEVETKDGVRIVHNTKALWGKTPKPQLEKIRTMGDLDTADEHVAFYMPLDMALDKEGNLYVLDTGNHRIQKFSPEGGYVATFGRQGNGPGEFHFPTSLDIDGSGNLIVGSQYSRKIQYLDTSGEERESLVVTEDFSQFVRALGAERLLTAAGRSSFFRDENIKAPDPLFQFMDRKGHVLGTFGKPRDYRNGLLNASGNSIHFCVGPDDSIYAGFQNQNRIDKYSPEGEIIWRTDRPMKFNTTKPLAKGKIERKGGGIFIRGPRWNKCTEAVAADAKGRVWVFTLRRQLKEDERAGTNINMSGSASGMQISMRPSSSGEVVTTDAYVLDVFDPQGAFLHSYPLDHFGGIMRFHGDRLYILDSLRRMQVHVYRIVE
jgi:hypothetical protein